MKAILCQEFGAPEKLVYGDLPRPTPGPGEVLVEVHAVGVNFTDLLAVEGRSQLKRVLPIVPGCEAAGVVLECGPGATRFKRGDRVMGCKASGSYAEEVVYTQDELALMPDAMSMDDAATFYIAAFTVRYSLEDRARLKAGENVLVLGAGSGVGLATIDIGKALGARVVAAASSDDKLELAKAHGADALYKYPRGPLDVDAQKKLAAELLALASHARVATIGKISSVREDAGFHVIVDGVGGSYAEPALRTLAWEGRYLSIGFAAGMAKVALGPLLFKNADILGIQPSNDDVRLPGLVPDNVRRMFGWYLEGRLRPHITQVLPLAQAAKALRAMADRAATGRIVLRTERHPG